MTHFMRRFGLATAVTGVRAPKTFRNLKRPFAASKEEFLRWSSFVFGILVCGMPGVARGDLAISGNFTGISDQGGYTTNPSEPFKSTAAESLLGRVSVREQRHHHEPFHRGERTVDLGSRFV